MAAFPQHIPYVTSLTGIPSETIIPGWATTVPTTGPDTNWIAGPAGFASTTPEIYVQNSKATTKITDQITTIPRMNGKLVDLEDPRIKEARRLLDICRVTHPQSSEFVWSWRDIPDSVTLMQSQHRMECLSLHQIVCYLDAMNNIGRVMLENQVDLRLREGVITSDVKEIVDGLWALYRNQEVEFQQSKELFPGLGPTFWPGGGIGSGAETLRITGYVTGSGGIGGGPSADMYGSVPPVAGDRNNLDIANVRLNLALYIHFLQDPEYNVLVAGYFEWLEGRRGGSRWVEMKNKITDKIKTNLGPGDAGTVISTNFIAALAKLEFQCLIGLSKDLIKYVIQFAGIARDHHTEFHDMNSVYSSKDNSSSRDASFVYKVFTVGRHQVVPLVPSHKGDVASSYIIRYDKYGFFKFFVGPRVDAASFVDLVPEENYVNKEDVEIHHMETIHSDEYEGDLPTIVPLAECLWMQGFAHRDISKQRRSVDIKERRAEYLLQRRVSIALHRSLHKSA